MPPVPLRATYRLQLHAGFTFADAARIVPYLACLGISHLYLSPIFTARTGSTHGYDVTDLTQVSPVLGGEEGLRVLSDTAGRAGLALIVDFVPNHMTASVENPWWADVLLWGRASPHAACFDIDWPGCAEETGGRIRLPVLGAPFADVLRDGHIALAFDAETGALSVRVYDWHAPLNAAGHAAVAGHMAEGESAAACFRRASEQANEQAGRDITAARASLLEGQALLAANASSVQQMVTAINDPANREALANLLEAQVWLLSYWREAGHSVSYRRFFDISDLVGMRTEDEDVFTLMHAKLLDLIGDGLIQGLRLDHVDGLRFPGAYLERLRHAIAATGAVDLQAVFPVHVEKILEGDERLPDHWACEGTTGYEFLTRVSALQVEPDAESALDAAMARFGGGTVDFHALVAEAKRGVLTNLLGGDISRLTRSLLRAVEDAPGLENTSRDENRAAVSELCFLMPVYRSYVETGPAREEDAVLLRRLMGEIESTLAETAPHGAAALRHVIETALAQVSGPARAALHDIQQVSGAAMAKALEDTAFYRFPRLLSLNEVGGDPARFGLDAAAFSRHVNRMGEGWPHMMLATATHDHKRGEDVRARLNALSTCPADWTDAVAGWHAAITVHRSRTQDGPAPSDMDLYTAFQLIIGAWPMEGKADDSFRDRITSTMIKSAREAKLSTSWTAPDEAYEAALSDCIARLLDPAAPVAQDLRRFAERLMPLAAVHGLAQTVLKLTAPGVPDIYQGAEFWDLSLVDPDNRRAVDFAARDAMLAHTPDWRAARDAWRSGAVKQYVIARLLAHRAAYPEQFAGALHPLRIEGPMAARFLAFARGGQGTGVITLVPCRPAPFMAKDSPALGGLEGHALHLPPALAGRRFTHLITEETLEPGEIMDLDTVLAQCPVAVLVPSHT